MNAESPGLRQVVERYAAAETFAGLEWQHFREGVEVCALYGQVTQGQAAAYLRYQPGATVPAHRHQAFEHVLVLEGSQSDEYGHYPAGSMLINGPSSSHRVVSEEGCVVLVIWSGGLSAL